MAPERDDWADRHVARWRDHWIDVAFDDDVEAIIVRISRIVRYFRKSKQEAVEAAGLQESEYDTLHLLLIRDTPGQATPSDLAEDLGISNAGMTGRLDSLERAGWIQRRTSAEDRRRVQVEATKAGVEVWRRAMDLRGRAEDELIGELSTQERTELARLLKKLTLRLEE
ncbi:MarR family transcriptional regulator [Nocardioides sp. CER19]|uniref:MarR family winged helix-turn-helix transcriptional regulator n=1 Tax=Nocardioides sp. CER19 TaxID=3038538 RepID=UPI00244B7916|nr:MarR family transcriptional regulator [Nocardioides sp. CER19]MDH2413545.1 MarR family transcriptional regulator [Nocardioides sp. CER19]